VPTSRKSFWHCPSARQQRISVMSKTITAVRSSCPRPIGGWLNAFSPGSACRLCDETSTALSCGVTSALGAGRYESANRQCATETGEQQRTKHFALARHY
jgi:hypothetical protein